MSNEDIINEYLNKLNEFKLPDYDKFPEIDLYMDQVLTYIMKITSLFNEDNQITSSMINNYVKAEIIPAPVTKKYNSEHLAKIIGILFLKPSVSMAEIKNIFNNTKDIKTAYSFLQEAQSKIFSNISLFAKENLNDISLDDNLQIYSLVVKLAINSYVNKLIADKLLSLISDNESIKNDKKVEKKEKKK